jgi:hypothetical protein
MGGGLAPSAAVSSAGSWSAGDARGSSAFQAGSGGVASADGLHKDACAGAMYFLLLSILRGWWWWCLSICLSVRPSVHLHVRPSVRLAGQPAACLSVSWCAC